MIAKLWAKQIVIGKRNFTEVPLSLKDSVREILLNMGYDTFE